MGVTETSSVRGRATRVLDRATGEAGDSGELTPTKPRGPACGTGGLRTRSRRRSGGLISAQPRSRCDPASTGTPDHIVVDASTCRSVRVATETSPSFCRVITCGSMGRRAQRTATAPRSRQQATRDRSGRTDRAGIGDPGRASSGYSALFSDTHWRRPVVLPVGVAAPITGHMCACFRIHRSHPSATSWRRCWHARSPESTRSGSSGQSRRRCTRAVSARVAHLVSALSLKLHERVDSAISAASPH
jgi:hypothetical protein